MEVKKITPSRHHSNCYRHVPVYSKTDKKESVK